MKRIKEFFKKIFKRRAKVEKKEFNINELTEAQQAKVHLLDDYYNQYIDVVENQIHSMKCDYYMHFIDDDAYHKKQEQFVKKLHEIRLNYIRDLEEICCSVA